MQILYNVTFCVHVTTFRPVLVTTRVSAVVYGCRSSGKVGQVKPHIAKWEVQKGLLYVLL